jgi:enoyl-CoA hydratase/carnithine racemase
LRVAVLTGAGGRAFIGGADVNELVRLEPGSARRFITTLHEACQAIRELPVPVIARIDGYCLGGGLEVAASCDLRVASEGSTFGMPEVRVGIPSVIEAALLPSIVGWGRARELVYTGESWGAGEALAAGLVEKVVVTSELDAAVEGWVAAILANGPRAIRAQKALIARWERLPIDEAIRAGIDAFEAAFESAEPQEYMRRFLERPRG